MNFTAQTQNPHTRKLLQTKEILDNEKFERKLEEVFAHHPHSARWKGAYIASNLFSHLANTYSFLTGGFAIGFILFAQLSGLLPHSFLMGLVILVAFGVALLLEILKRSTNTNFFKIGFSDHWDKTTALAIVGLMALSVGLSFYASIKLPMATAPLPTLKDIGIVEADFETQIEELKAERNQFRANRLYKGKLASKDAKVITQYNEDIKTLRQAQTNVITAITADNEATLLAHKENLNSFGFMLGYISIVMELLFVLSFWYQYRFLWNCYLERSKADEQESTVKTNNFQQFSGQPGNQAPSARKSMQIKFGDKLAGMDVITGVSATKTLIKNTVEHTSFVSGKTKQVTAGDIRRNLDTYAVRIEDSLEKLKTRQGDPIVKELHNRIGKYMYWTGRSMELNHNYAQLLD